MRRRIGPPLSFGAGVALLGFESAVAAPQSAPFGQVPEDGGPTVLTSSLELEPLRFYGFDAALEAEWRRNVDELDPDSGPGQRQDFDRWREIFTLKTAGFVGHPNLLEFNLGGSLWLEQQSFDTSETSRERVNQTLYEWDVSGRALKETWLPITLYSRQNVSDIDRQFGGTVQNTFLESGLRLNLRHPVAPTNLQVFRRRIDQTDTADGRDFTVDQDTIMGDGRVDLGLNHRLAWDAKYDDVDESGDLRTPRSFTRFEANANHTLEFGELQQNVLRTHMRLYDESGDQPLRQVRIDPRLRLTHSEDLISWYDYSFGRDDRRDQEQTTNRATANVQHQLFDSLTSIGTAGFNLVDIPTDDFDSDEIFGRADLQYLKQVPLGRLAAGLGGSWSRLDQSERGTDTSINDDLRIFDAAGRITIDVRNIVPSSIVVTDVTGIFVYTDGVDYSVDDFPDRVEIRRLPGGDIGPNQAVLIDYVIGPEPGGTTDTTGFSVDLRYTFEEGPLTGLAGYVQYVRQDESRTNLTDDFPENDYTDVRYGIEYDVWKLNLRAERQHRDSTLSPFDATRIEGRFTESLGRGSNIVLSALYQDIDREDGSRTQTTTFSGQWRQQIDDQLQLALVLQYQQTEDTLSFDSEAFEQQLDLVWRRGMTEIYAQVRNSINENESDRSTFQRFTVGVRREF